VCPINSLTPCKNVIGDFDAKVSREYIFKLPVGNDCLHEISNDNGVRVVSLAMYKNLTVRSTMFSH
jgi:hypothetical protein